MKECIKCRQELADDAIFCHACGTKQIQEPKKCFKCGAPLVEGSAFCSKCGTRQDPENSTQTKQTVSPEYSSSEISNDIQGEMFKNFIQRLKEIPTELKAVALCFLLIPLFRIPEFHFDLSGTHITDHPLLVFGLIFCVLVCLSSIIVGVLIFIKKEKFLVFAFSPIVLAMLPDYIAALYLPGGATTFVFFIQALILPAYILITFDSLKIYINKPLLPKITKLYAIAALIIAVIIRKKLQLLDSGSQIYWNVDSSYFMSAGFIIWLVYILRHNNKIQ